MKRDDVSLAKARGAEREENRGRDWSKFSPLYEARVMGHCVDVALSLDTLKRDCIKGKNGQSHPIEIWALDTVNGMRRRALLARMEGE